jgi:hypothetical protein
MDVRRGYASDRGKKELYSDEAGSTGAGVSVIFSSREAGGGMSPVLMVIEHR